MKILDIPQSGKRGQYISLDSRYGQVNRIVSVAKNPETPSQMTIRRILTKVSGPPDQDPHAAQPEWSADRRPVVQQD